MYYIYHIVDKVTRFVVYIGSTNDITHRFITHKSYCHNPNSTNYNQRIYQYIRENGGFKNFECVEVFRLPDYCKNMVPYIERQEIINNLMTVKNIRYPRPKHEMCEIQAAA
jgi:citrate lyase synthetase